MCRTKIRKKREKMGNIQREIQTKLAKGLLDLIVSARAILGISLEIQKLEKIWNAPRAVETRKSKEQLR